VKQFLNGDVKDVAANSTFGFVNTADGKVCFSENFLEWYEVFPDDVDDRHKVRMIAAGTSFAVGATFKETVIMMTPTPDKTLLWGEWDLSKLAGGPIAKIAGMDGSSSFVCILAEVEAADDYKGEATKSAATESTE
jgi:hypothetical protein